MKTFRASVLLLACAAVAPTTACTIGGVHALPPEFDGGNDGDGGGGVPDAPIDEDAACVSCCVPGENTDGDELDDCAEAMDADPWTDPLVWNGVHVTIGDRPEFTGSCDNLDDYAEMTSRFTGTDHVMDVWAGWEFDTAADAYTDGEYGFAPAWPPPAAANERFSVRYHGHFAVAQAGRHCFRIDTGATGTDIIGGKNECGQIWLDQTLTAETGMAAQTSGPATACVDLAAGDAELDVVFWYFNIFEQAKLQLRHCFGDAADCTPDQMISAAELHATP